MAATWIAGTGACLLLAATALFIAVRWDRLSDEIKLAVVLGLTGAFLGGGRLLRRRLPATGDVVFHLGAFVLPVDLAAVNVRIGMGWRGLLLAEGVLGLVAFGPLAAGTGSVVLGWAFGAAMVATAAGVAGISPLPAPLVLATVALVAHLARRHRVAVAWAVVAGLGPLAGLAVAGTAQAVSPSADLGAGVLAELGLAGRPQSLVAVLAGGLAAVVLGREAAARRDLGLATVAAASLAAGGVMSWVAAEPGLRLTVLALAAVFLVLEVAAVLTRRDPFWAAPAQGLALAVEATAASITGFLFVELLLLAPMVETGLGPVSDEPLLGPDAVLTGTLVITASAWLVAGRRRRLDGSSDASLLAPLAHPLAGPFAAASAVVAVEVGARSAGPISVALVAAGAALVAAGGTVSLVVGAAFAAWAPTVSWNRPLLALAAGAAAAAILGAGATARVRRRERASVVAGYGLAAVACFCALEGALWLFVMDPEVPGVVSLSFAVGALWTLGCWLDRERPALGDVARASVALPVVVALSLDPVEALAVSGAAGLALLVDALRLDRPGVALGTAVAAQLVVVHACRSAGLSLPEAGLGLCAGAVVWSGLAVLATSRWRLPLLASAAMGSAAGMALASGDPAASATAVLVVGSLGVAAGLVLRRPELGHVGGLWVVSGIVSHLALNRVDLAEAYAVPAAAQLLVLGAQARHRSRLSSWWAYGPAVTLLGGAALAERLAGGSGWHAVAAGSVGVAAVAVGGWRRLGGPLLLGTGLLAVVTVVESLPALAGVPTWGWLAAGGSVLVGVGVALEHGDTSPGEAGRRLVDAISDRFE